MEASILDLRYKMHDVLKALSLHESVSIKYHGKVKGEIIPKGSGKKRKSSDHPLFGILKDTGKNPAEIVSEIRRSR